eukprot:Skav217426  [mRNA]  locus=scaffold1729:48600:49433:+ [translate_table: standard]
MGNTFVAEVEASLPVCVLHPSGEVAYRGHVAKASTVKELVLRISEEGLGPAHRLSLVAGSEVLPGNQSLEHLERGEELCLQLVRSARTEFTKSAEGKQPDWLARCAVLGPAKVGKSALLAQYCHQTFSQTYTPTIGLEFHHAEITTKCQQFRFKVFFLDFSGLDRFRALTFHHLRGATCIIAVFSFNSRASLQEAVSMLQEALRFHEPVGVLISLVGTHADSDQQEVSEDEAMAEAEKLHCSYHAVSNATGQGVPEACHNWLDEYLDRMYQPNKSWR